MLESSILELGASRPPEPQHVSLQVALGVGVGWLEQLLPDGPEAKSRNSKSRKSNCKSEADKADIIGSSISFSIPTSSTTSFETFSGSTSVGFNQSSKSLSDIFNVFFLFLFSNFVN